jgi:hypothetical protein
VMPVMRGDRSWWPRCGGSSTSRRTGRGSVPITKCHRTAVSSCSCSVNRPRRAVPRTW